MAKKKQSQNAENVQNAYDAYQSEVQQAGQNVVEGMQTAGAQQLADLEAANNAYNEANNAAIEANRQQSNAAIGSFADMVNQYAENIRRAEDEGAAQVAASQRAARWAGATELASSIANLVAVGGHNAVSQQYRPFSQDWMRKADQDARMNRMRIDNLRERQRAMQGQLANLRLNDAARALELAREQAKTNYQQGLTMAETRYNTTINPLNQAAKNAEAVGKIGVQAASDVASTAQRDRQLDQSDASLAQRQREHNAEMMAKGYNPDGTINEKAMSALEERAIKTTKSGSDKSKDAYFFSDNGRQIPYYMSSNERKGFLERAYAKVKDMPGFKDEYGEKADLRDEDHNGIILKYAENDPELREELYSFSSPEYRRSQEITNAVNGFFAGTTPPPTTEGAGSGVAAIFPNAAPAGSIWKPVRPENQ